VRHGRRGGPLADPKAEPTAEEIHLCMDIKPEFPDKPRDGEVQLKFAFYRAEIPRP
jgi:hypothetical protein